MEEAGPGAVDLGVLMVRGYRHHARNAHHASGALGRGRTAAGPAGAASLWSAASRTTEDVESPASSGRAPASTPGLHPSSAEGLRHNSRAFGAIATVEYAISFVPDLNFTGSIAAGRRRGACQLVLPAEPRGIRRNDAIGTAR